MSIYAKNWLKTLIDASSVTPSDGGLMDVLGAHFTEHGFSVERHDRNDVKNMVAFKGSGPLLVFLGHLDVVPAANGWQTNPFSLVEKDGVYYGRGVADMKGAIAAFMGAIQNLTLPYRIAIALTSDEEGPAVDGSVVLAERLQKEKPFAVLVGEPSSTHAFGDTLRVGRRGSLTANVVLRGKASHVALGAGDSAAVHLQKFLNWFYAQSWPGIAGFPPTIAHITGIECGVANNVVPDEARVRINWRYSGEHTAIQEKMAEYECSWIYGAYPFLSTPGRLQHALTKSIQEHTGLTPVLSTGGGTSDARFFAPFVPEVIEFGLPNATIHQANEQVLVADFEKLEAIYSETLQLL